MISFLFYIDPLGGEEDNLTEEFNSHFKYMSIALKKNVGWILMK